MTEWNVVGDYEYITDENGTIICIIPKGTDSFTVAKLLNSNRMYWALMDFVVEVDNGSMPARKMYNTFKAIIDNINGRQIPLQMDVG